MSNATITVRTLVDLWEVKDLTDGSTLRVVVESHPEMGHRSLPGLMIHCMGRATRFEPGRVGHWADQATRSGHEVFLLTDESWTPAENQSVRMSLVLGPRLKARVEVRVPGRKASVRREYVLPFTVSR